MASSSFPRPGHNGGAVTTYEHELLNKKAVAEGVHGFPTDPAPVYADPTLVRTVRIRADTFAHVRGSLYWSGPTDITLPQLAANTSGFPRIDSVVLRLNRSDYRITEAVITGTPAKNPVPPAAWRDGGSTGFWDLPMADVRVENGATSLTADKITRRCWYIGEDGQIRCTPDTRPPHQAGRYAWDTRDGFIVSTGARWMVVGVDGGQAAMSINTSIFVATHNTLWRRNGWAWAELTANRPGGQLNPNTLYHVATLPTGYRPPVLWQFPLVVPGNNQSVGVGSVSPEGLVRINPGGKAIPSGYNFVCALGAWPIGS